MPAQIFYCLSEWHTHVEFAPAGIGKPSGLPQVITQAVFMVMKFAAYLPRLHRQQASPRDTSLLMVGPVLHPGHP